MLRRDSGQSAVEFMLVLPLVLLVLLAIAEFGAAFYTYVTLNNAASEAARWASVGHVPDATCDVATKGIQWRAEVMSRGLVNCSDPDVAFAIEYDDAGSGQPARGTAVTVRVTRLYQARTPLPAFVSFITAGALFPSSWSMSACSDARLEQRLPSGTYVLGTAGCGA